MRIASIGDIPSLTSNSNSLAWLSSVHGNPPASVPNAIFTPALRALSNDRACDFSVSAQTAQPAAVRGPAT